MFGGILEWRPRPTPGCSAIEEEYVPAKFHAPMTKLSNKLSQQLFERGCMDLKIYL
jgi:hypothetical protein